MIHNPGPSFGRLTIEAVGLEDPVTQKIIADEKKQALAPVRLARFEALRSQVGDAPVKDGVEMQKIMAEVAEYYGPDTWQFCTINEWLLGAPSEDDLSWKAEYFSEMPRLEERCGDHSLGDQYNAAFYYLKEAGAPAAFVQWLKTKQGNLAAQKVAIAEKEGSENLDKAKRDAGWALSGTAGLGLVVAAVVFYAMRRQPVVVVPEPERVAS